MSKHWIADIPDKFIDFVVYPQQQTGKMCHEYAEKSCLNNFWTRPLHGAVCVLTMAATPLIMAIALVVAFILVPAPLCCEEFSYSWYQENVIANLEISLFSIIAPFFLLYAIAFPDNRCS